MRTHRTCRRGGCGYVRHRGHRWRWSEEASVLKERVGGEQRQEEGGEGEAGPDEEKREALGLLPKRSDGLKEWIKF